MSAVDAIERMARLEELREAADRGRQELARREEKNSSDLELQRAEANVLDAPSLVYKTIASPAPAQPAPADVSPENRSWVEEVLMSSEFIDIMGRMISAERTKARLALLASERDMIDRQRVLELEVSELRGQVTALNFLITGMANGDDVVVDLKHWRSA